MRIQIEIDSKTKSGSKTKIAIEEGGEAVGTAVVKIDDHNAELESICVRPQKRGKGYGSKLFSSVKQYAQNLGAKEMTGEFVPVKGEERDGLKFYQRHGIALDKNGCWKVKL